VKVLCAWCLKEGKPAFLGENKPLEDPTESHGICADHLTQVKLRLALDEAETEFARFALLAIVMVSTGGCLQTSKNGGSCDEKNLA
jgi:hypothetical protein